MNNKFSLIDLSEVMSEVKLGRSTIWKNVQDGKFPQPIAGRRRACWARIQITDYLYQLARHGEWSATRTNLALDKAYNESFDSIDRGEYSHAH